MLLLRVPFVLLIPLALLLAAMACGGDDPTTAPLAPTTAPASTTGPAPAPTAMPVATATPESAPDDGLADKLTIAINNFDKDDLDPYRSGKTNLASPDPFADFLIGVTRDNALTNVWGWSDSWEQIDGKTWDLTLRDDLKFHDGYGFADAADVKEIADLWATDDAVGSHVSLLRDVGDAVRPHRDPR